MKLLQHIPVYIQEKWSSDCGLICIQMILAFYNEKIDFETLSEKITVYDFWTRAWQLWIYMQNKWYKTSIVTANPKLFSKKSYTTYTQNPAQYIQEIKKIDERSRDYLIEYIQWWTIEYAIPDISVIKDALDTWHPIIALMTTNFLTSQHQSFNSHFVVVVWYDSKDIIVHDPIIWKTHISHQEFFFGLHANCYWDHDNGSLMII